MNKAPAKIICCFIPSKAMRRKVRDIFGFGLFKYLKALRASKAITAEPGHYLAICAIAKDEGGYFKEWLDYHLLAGVKKFYIYDNESSDNTKEVLGPYIQAGIVEYKYWPGKKQQTPAYDDCLSRHKYDSRWLAFVDLDEFIVPAGGGQVPDMLKDFPDEASQLLVGWVMYGSSGHEVKPKGLVIENYRMRADESRGEYAFGFKAMVKPRFCYQAGVHFHRCLCGKTVDENGREITNPGNLTFLPRNKIRVNHYHCKSWEDYQKRRKRGDAVYGIFDPDRCTRQYFDANNFNDVYDPIMDRFIEQLRDL